MNTFKNVKKQIQNKQQTEEECNKKTIFEAITNDSIEVPIDKKKKLNESKKSKIKK
jgi:hypothetical protein